MWIIYVECLIYMQIHEPFICSQISSLPTSRRLNSCSCARVVIHCLTAFWAPFLPKDFLHLSGQSGMDFSPTSACIRPSYFRFCPGWRISRILNSSLSNSWRSDFLLVVRSNVCAVFASPFDADREPSDRSGSEVYVLGLDGFHKNQCQLDWWPDLGAVPWNLRQ